MADDILLIAYIECDQHVTTNNYIETGYIKSICTNVGNEKFEITEGKIIKSFCDKDINIRNLFITNYQMNDKLPVYVIHLELEGGTRYQ